MDGIGRITERTTRSGSIIFGIETDGQLSRYLVEKGSVTVDGISLTVNSCRGNKFYINIPDNPQVKPPWVSERKATVNIETDIIGKYVERFLQSGERCWRKPGGKLLDVNFLAEHGFK